MGTTPNGEDVASASAPCCQVYNYTIEGSRCQGGFYCPCCCDATLDITTADGDDTGGSVVRPSLTCAEMCKKTNRMEINFPEGVGDEDKVGLLGGAMLFEILEEIKQQQNENNSGGGGGS